MSMVRVPESAEVVVVGGGCMGASIAWHVARRGAVVVLLERTHVASGATGHSGALVRRHYEHPVGIRLAHESLRFFETFARRTGYPAGFVRVGFTAGARERDLPALRRLLAVQRECGVAARLLTVGELHALEPAMEVSDLAAGIYDARAGYADPVATALGFARAATDAGAKIYEGVEVRRLLVAKSRVVGVRTAQSTIFGEHIVVAAGNWTPALLATAGARVPVRFVRGEIAFFRRPPSVRGPRLHFDYYHNTYSRPDEARDTLVGFMNTDARPSQPRPTPFDGTLRASTAKDLQARLAARFPAMARAQFRGGYAGLYDVTPDHYPILGRVGPEGLFVALGFSGHGFKLSPAVGRLMADAVLGTGRDPDLAALASSRFARGRMLRPAVRFPARGRRLP
jgi:glycine/D-amino acid oxidase-like deaminating enzyme